MQALSQEENFWNDADKAKEVLQDISTFQSTIKSISDLVIQIDDLKTLLSLSEEESDNELLQESILLIESIQKSIQQLEFKCKMRGEFDNLYAIIEVNSGSGGTEAQDWALMLLRMYIRWAERKGFKLEELDYQQGDVAGIKSSTLLVQGEFAYGFLRSEQGVHRLVRISPFDSNARRHTSFASISVTPNIEEDIEVIIDDKDLRVDTYRSSGAGGQHVNKTDSAVRLTHIPTGTVVACQNERSQHKNKDRAMKILKAKLYEIQKDAHKDKLDEVKGERRKIDFGSQIRSYVMQPYQLVKDTRTNYETSAVNDVLDGDIDKFIEAFLLS